MFFRAFSLSRRLSRALCALALTVVCAAVAGLLAVAPAGAASCTDDVCGLALVNVDGSDYITSMTYRTDRRPGMSNPVGVAVASGLRFFSLRDRGDGSVYIRDVNGMCLYAGDDSGGLAFVRACQNSPDEAWYFQNEDYTNSFAIRKAFTATGQPDDRCLDVRNGDTAPWRTQLQVIPCKSSGGNWQKFSPVSPDPAEFARFKDAVQERATRFASTQCERAVVVRCSFSQVSTSQPVLSDPVPLGQPVHNFQQQDTTESVSVAVTKSATVTFGFSQKFSIKVEAGVDGFAKTEWLTEQAWSAGKAWTDTTMVTQTVNLRVPAGGSAWVSYAQLTRKIAGNVLFQVADTGKSWRGQTEAVMPAVNSGNQASQLVLCDDRSTQKVCRDTAGGAVNARSGNGSSVAVAAGDAWLVTVEGADHACSGAAISDTWILTAKHCSRPTQVRYTTASGAGAPPVAVDRVVDSPTGDVRMVHLSTPHPLASYPGVNLAYTPRAGDAATGYTVGVPAAPAPMKATVPVAGTARDALGGADLITARAAWAPELARDAGGPLLVGGRIVGVGSVAGAGTAPLMTYASLTGSASIIAAETIGAVTVQKGLVSVTIGKNLLASATRTVVWADGGYVGETASGAAYSAMVRPNADGSVTASFHVKPGSLVAVGFADGTPDRAVPITAGRVQCFFPSDTTAGPQQTR